MHMHPVINAGVLLQGELHIFTKTGEKYHWRPASHSLNFLKNGTTVQIQALNQST
jgi:hypothetical protein